MNLHHHTKSQFIPSIHSWDTANFGVPWPDWTHPSQIFLINFLFMWICINMQKIRLFHWFVLKIRLIKKSYNLIDWEHFGPYLRNQNFPKYVICAGTKQIISIFIIKQILQKLTIKFFNILKKPRFWPIFPIFGAKIFFWKIRLCHAKPHGFLASWQNLEKN